MKSFVIDLSANNKALIPFVAAGSEANSVIIKNAELAEKAKGTFKLLNAIYKVLTGNDLNPDDSCLNASFKDRSFKRFYSPYLAQNDGTPVIVWGKELIELSAQKALKVTPKLEGFPEGDIQVGFKWANITGLGAEMLLSVSIWLEAAETGITMYFPCRSKDWEKHPIKEEDLATFELYASRSAKDLHTRLGEPVKPSQIIRLPQLAKNVEFAVIGYTSGDNMSLTLGHSEEGYYYPWDEAAKKPNFDEDKAVDFNPDEVVKVWANSRIKPTLLADPLITPEMPAKLIVTAAKQTKNGSWAADVVFELHPDSLAKLSESAEEEPDFDI